MERIGVIIVAGGSGCRMGTTLPKQFLLLGGQPVLARTINLFARTLPGAAIVVVLPEAYRAFWRDFSARFAVARHTVVAGGAERFHSVSRGLDALPPDVGLIAVHDAVRPLAPPDLIRRTVAAATAHGAAVPVVEPADSFRRLDSDGSSHPLDRRELRAVQTPQVFRAKLLRDAYETAYSPAFTDDATVVEHAGHTVFLCAGDRRNFKITIPDDLSYAEALLMRPDVPDDGPDSDADDDDPNCSGCGHDPAACTDRGCDADGSCGCNRKEDSDRKGGCSCGDNADIKNCRTRTGNDPAENPCGCPHVHTTPAGESADRTSLKPQSNDGNDL